MTDLNTADRKLIERAYTDANLGPALRNSVAFKMAEQRLATAGYFWQAPLGRFVHVD